MAKTKLAKTKLNLTNEKNKAFIRDAFVSEQFSTQYGKEQNIRITRSKFKDISTKTKPDEMKLNSRTIRSGTKLMSPANQILNEQFQLDQQSDENFTQSKNRCSKMYWVLLLLFQNLRLFCLKQNLKKRNLILVQLDPKQN